MSGQLLTQSNFEAIVCHNQSLIAGCDKAIAKLKSIPKEKRTSLVENHIDHWEKMKSALKWSTAIARQKYRGAGNVNG